MRENEENQRETEATEEKERPRDEGSSDGIFEAVRHTHFQRKVVIYRANISIRDIIFDRYGVALTWSRRAYAASSRRPELLVGGRHGGVVLYS